MTNTTTVVLTRHERKDRLGHGGIRAIARELGIHESFVSRVMNGKERHAGIEDAIASRIELAENEVAFPPRVAA
jgi:DNA-binding LacI/PurR family transcriptional regulator